jgi:hypothetical protein
VWPIPSWGIITRRDVSLDVPLANLILSFTLNIVAPSAWESEVNSDLFTAQIWTARRRIPNNHLICFSIDALLELTQGARLLLPREFTLELPGDLRAFQMTQ